MADLKFRFPYGSYDDPTREILLTLVDQGDGTFAPKISGAVSGTSGSSGGAPTDVNYLVGTASGDLSNEIVVGTTPGGELGGTWGSPTVDATHSGSSHASIQTAAESTAAVALAAHTAAADPHAGYVLESLIDAAGDLIVGTADNTVGRKAIGASGKILQSDGTTIQWVTEPAADLVAAAGDLLYGSAADTLAKLAIGASGKVLQSNGTLPTWATAPGAEIDYVALTTSVSVTNTSEGSADTVVSGSSVVYDGSTIVWVEFFCPAAEPQATASAALTFLLYDGGTILGYIGGVRNPASGNMRVPFTGKMRVTPSNATHQFIVKAMTSTGTASAGAGAGGTGDYVNGYIRITKA